MPRTLILAASVALAVGVILLDHFSGPHVRFAILYPIPVGLATWFGSKWLGAALALALPAGHVVMLELAIGPRVLAFDDWLNSLISFVVLAALVILLELKRQRDALRSEVRALHGLLPICSFCKKIRNDDKKWEPIETYIAARSEAEFTHGVCASCAKQHYGVLVKED